MNCLAMCDRQHSMLTTVGAPRSYSPYGARMAVAGLRLAYCGQVLEVLTGAYLLGNGHRGYDPCLMRFVSPDTLSPFEKGGVNAYAYCRANPINYQDASGRSGVAVGKGSISNQGAYNSSESYQLAGRHVQPKKMLSVGYAALEVGMGVVNVNAARKMAESGDATVLEVNASRVAAGVNFVSAAWAGIQSLPAFDLYKMYAGSLPMHIAHVWLMAFDGSIKAISIGVSWFAAHQRGKNKVRVQAARQEREEEIAVLSPDQRNAMTRGERLRQDRQGLLRQLRCVAQLIVLIVGHGVEGGRTGTRCTFLEFVMNINYVLRFDRQQSLIGAHGVARVYMPYGSSLLTSGPRLAYAGQLRDHLTGAYFLNQEARWHLLMIIGSARSTQPCESPLAVLLVRR